MTRTPWLLQNGFCKRPDIMQLVVVAQSPLIKLAYLFLVVHTISGIYVS